MNGLSFMKGTDIRLNISIFSYLSGHELTILEIPFPVRVHILFTIFLHYCYLIGIGPFSRTLVSV